MSVGNIIRAVLTYNLAVPRYIYEVASFINEVMTYNKAVKSFCYAVRRI